MLNFLRTMIVRYIALRDVWTWSVDPDYLDYLYEQADEILDGWGLYRGEL